MKYGKDERFKGIEKMKERESLFTEFVTELKKKEKENIKVKQDKVGVPFVIGVVQENAVLQSANYLQYAINLLICCTIKKSHY